jgi:hypothetical protein
MRVLVAGLVAAIVLAGSVAAVVSAQSPDQAIGTPATVRAVAGWQDAPVNVVAGDGLEFRDITGTWTINVAGRWFDATGYPGYYPRDIQGVCHDAQMLDEQNGALIGRLGGGPPFLIGLHLAMTADRSGPLQMRMNDADACLPDNGGSIALTVVLSPSLTTPIPAASATSGPVATPSPDSPPAQPSPTAAAPQPTAGASPTPAGPTAAGLGVPTAASLTASPTPTGSATPTAMALPRRLPATGGIDWAPQLLAIVGLLMVLATGAWRSRGPRLDHADRPKAGGP